MILSFFFLINYDYNNILLDYKDFIVNTGDYQLIIRVGYKVIIRRYK